MSVLEDLQSVLPHAGGGVGYVALAAVLVDSHAQTACNIYHCVALPLAAAAVSLAFIS